MRVRGGALAGLFVLSAAVGGCSESSGSTAAPPVTTIAIATEAPTASTAPAAPPTAVSTTVVASTTTLVPPVPVLVRVTPKNDTERELLDAMKVLLRLHHRIVMVQGIDDATIRLAYVGRAADDVMGDIESAKAQGRFSVPGDVDRYVVDSIQVGGGDNASAIVCFANNATSFARFSTGDRLVDDSLVSRNFSIDLLRTSDGWRISSLAITSQRTGVDSCAL